MKAFLPLVNVVQNYEWGSVDGIAAITGIQNPNNAPFAELWMGTHPAGCSRLASETSSPAETFSDVVRQDMIKASSDSNNTNGGLPFLFKLLSAASPLSLQVHPSKSQAEIGFTKENALGVPIDSPNRNYRDANHKPEIILALTPFKAMCGFRPIGETIRNLQMLGMPELADFAHVLDETADYGKFVGSILLVDKDKAEKLCVELAARMEELSVAHRENGEFALAINTASRLLEKYPTDMGVLAPLYLNVLDLNPGEALYLPAGILHAYLSGTGLELMASSDNVLRGGLTNKHIDIRELVSVLDGQPFTPEKIKPITNEGIRSYPTPAPDFHLSGSLLAGGSIAISRSAPTILICTAGSLRLQAPDCEPLTIKKGSVCYIRVSEKPCAVMGKGECWWATLPSNGGTSR